MINEHTFVERYTSFWSAATPTGPHFVRRMNLQLEALGAPMADTSADGKRALVNEAAFRLFTGKVMIGETAFDEAVREAWVRTRALPRQRRIRMPSLSPAERDEVAQIAKSLHAFFSSSPPCDCLVGPVFPGCGILDACAGDVLQGDILYEVKAGARGFRLTDVRQLLTYCALNYPASRYDIARVGLVNPREAVHFIVPIETLTQEVAGRPSCELFATILNFLEDQADYTW